MCTVFTFFIFSHKNPFLFKGSKTTPYDFFVEAVNSA